jgi:hypothetical protein
VCVLRAEYGSEERVRIGGAPDRGESRTEQNGTRELQVALEAAAEAERTTTGEATKPQVGQHVRQCVEDLERLVARKIRGRHSVWHGAVLSPLHVYSDLSLSSPIGVQNVAVPIGPEIRRSQGGVVADPELFLVGTLREGRPASSDVVLVREEIRDYAPRGVQNGNRSLQRERFVPLEVQHWSQIPREERRGIVWRDSVG